jgi:hypothetical protein
MNICHEKGNGSSAWRPQYDNEADLLPIIRVDPGLRRDDKLGYMSCYEGSRYIS